MKKALFTMLMMLTLSITAFAQAEIRFEHLEHDYGKFSEKDGVQTCEFKFKNNGDKPLVVNRAVASCGCTVPSYTKQPIAPGETGVITVKYNGEGKFPCKFRKTITVYTNGKREMTRLYITGEMTE